MLGYMLCILVGVPLGILLGKVLGIILRGVLWGDDYDAGDITMGVLIAEREMMEVLAAERGGFTLSIQTRWKFWTGLPRWCQFVRFG
jgi:hypothetical protein